MRRLTNRTSFLHIWAFVAVFVLFIIYYTVSHGSLKVIDRSKTTGAEHEFIDTKLGFQRELSLTQPDINLESFKAYKPHNFVPGAKQETLATFLCTPNASIFDPYFAATLNLVYRNLWSPSIASTRPFTVFVAPFISQEQRSILAGAGAVIQELPLVEWTPNVSGVFSRWRDQFSKLHFWNQTQYSTIVFMDSDAFPIKNIDSVFDELIIQTCDASKLTGEDLNANLCQYTFAGVHNLGGGVNGGFLALTPDVAMHERLLRDYVKVDQYDNHVAEQSFFRWEFAEDGPFPAQMLPRKYNAYFPGPEDEGFVSIVHEKLWALSDSAAPWLTTIWDQGWQEMIQFFNSEAFAVARQLDDTIDGSTVS